MNQYIETSYALSTRIHLSLENWYNAGLTSEEAKETIENIINPFSSTKELLDCEQGDNENWIVEVFMNDQKKIEHIVDVIEWQLWFKLYAKETAEFDQ